MKTVLLPQQIQKIAEELEAGFTSFVSKTTDEILTIPDLDEMDYL
ncbi:MAG: hypothetical protein ACKVOM_03370 [Ferruginibacter sp.]